MTDKNNKKIFTRHPAVTKFLVVFLTGSFLFGNNALAVNDYTKATGATPVSSSWNSLVSNYDKPLSGSLSAPEWNGLFYDFVNTWTTANMAGPLGIGSASPSAALDVFSKVKITSGGIIYNTDSGRYLDMSGTLSDSLKVSGNLYSTAGVLKIDGTGSNYLMGNVGIGTVSPAAALHVNYPTSGSAIFQVGTADGGSNADIKLGYNGYGWYWRYLGSGAGDNNELQLWSEGAGGTDQQAYGIKQSGIITFPKNVYFNGNIGVSTTTPAAALDVNGLIKMRSFTISQPEDVINKSYLDSALSSSTASIITQVATSSFWQGSLTGSAYSSNTGNIGIGTSTPGAKLQVNGNAIFGMVAASSAVANPLNVSFGSTYGNSTPGSVNNLKWDLFTSSSSGSRYGIGMSSGLMEFQAGPGGGLGFFVNQGTEAMRIISGGNVGIGTTNPLAKLDIQGSFGNNLTIGSTGNAGNLTMRRGNDGSGVFTLGFPSAAESMEIRNSQSGGGGYYTWFTNYSSTVAERMRLDNAGNLGINNVAPAYKLDVNGTAQFTNSVIVGTPTAASHAATKSYVDSAAGGGVGAGTSGQTLRHNGTNWVANSTLYNNGTNIGIGTITTAYKLDVNGTFRSADNAYFDKATFIKDYNGTADSWWGWYAWDKEFQFNKRTSANAFVQNIFAANWDTGNLIIVPSGGNVGINTSTPAFKLDVNGTAQFTNSVIVGTPTATNHAATKSYVDSAAASAAGSTWTVNGANIHNSNSGNVGVGTNNPGAKFSVVATTSYGTDSTYAIHAVNGINALKRLVLGYDDVINAGVIASTHSGTAWTNTVINPAGGNVGIGSTVPAFKLDVAGTAQFTNSVIVGTPTAASHAATKSYVDSAAGGGVGAGTSGQTLRHNGTNWIANSLFYNNGTNIGIGTTNPIQKLQVSGNIYPVAGVVYVDDGYGLRSSVTDSGIYPHSTNGVIVKGGGSEIARFSQNGNVGLGTTTPSFKLDVNGTAQFTNSVIVGTPTAASHAATKSYVDSAAGGGVGAGTSGQTLRHNGSNWVSNSLLYNNGTNVGINSVGPLVRLTVNQGSYNWPATSTVLQTGGFRIQAESGGNVTLDAGVNGASGAWLQTTNRTDLSQEYPLMLNPNGGNVGVGTTIASYNFDVTGTGRFTNTVTVGTPTAASHAATKSYVDSTAGGGVGSGTSGQTLRHNGTSWIANSNFYNNGTNIGIGTTTPGYKLEVSGDGKFLNNLVIGGATMLTEDGSGTLKFGRLGGNSTAIYSASSEAIRINTSGNVGIGTTTPGFKLDVSGTAQFTNSVVVGTPTAASHAATKSYVDSAAASAAGSTWTVSGSNIYNSNSGNVGVGTNNPTTRLSVVSNSTDIATFQGANNFGYGILKILGGTANSPYWRGSFIGANIKMTSTYPEVENAGYRAAAVGFGSDSGEGHLGFFTTSATTTGYVLSEQMRISSNGNVGISTTNPLYKLDVNGTAQFTQPVIIGTPTATNHAATKSYVDSTASSAAGGGVGTGTSGQTLRHNGTSWISNSVLYNNGTNIGVGTTNPITKLEVAGGVRASHAYIYGTPDATSGAMIYLRDTQATSTGTYFGGISFFSTPGTDYSIGKLTENGASSLAFKNADTGSEYMRITSSGNVGIGTTNTVAKLDVVGTAQFTNSVIVGTPTAASHATTKSYVDSAVSGVGGGISTGTSGQTLRHNGTSWVSNSVLYNNGTNVGVGTTNPGSKLEVYGGSIKINGGDINFAMTAGQTATKLVSYSNASGLWMIQPTSQSLILADAVDWDRSAAIQYTPGTTGALAGRLMIGQTAKNSANYTHGITSLYTSGVEQLRINSSGNVGIGTTTPTFKLDVVGTAQFSQPVIVGTPTATNHAATKSYVDSTASSAAGGGVGTGTSGQTLRHNGTSWISNSALYNNGTNVGIGTTVPTAKLHVAGNSYFSGVSNFGGINISSLSNVDTSETMWAYYDASNSDARTGYFGIRNDSSLQVGIEFRENNSGNSGEYFKIKTGSGTDRLFIDESGNVGLSTTTPTFRLDVVGTAQFSQPVIVGTPTATNHAATKSYVDSTAASAASSAAGGGVGTGTSGQTLRHNGTSWVANSLFYNNGTNIGIGTGAPATKLHVYNAVDGVFNGLVIDNRKAYGVGTGINETSRLLLSLSESTVTDPTSRIFGYMEAGTNSENSSSDGWLAFGNRTGGAATEKLRITSDGNVGIGTVTPSASLDVTGKLKLTSGGTIYNTDSARWLDMTGTLTDSLKASGDFYSTAGRLKMNGTGVSYVMGTFGVGTATPSKTMQVFGASASFRVGPNYTDPDRDYIDVLSGGTNSTIQTNNEGFIFNNLGGPLTLQTSGGNVGIATTTPTEAKLVISAGTGMAIKAYGNGIFTGTLQTQTGSDFAEEFSTTKDLEPGTVVVMDDNGHKSVKPCAKSYDKTVVGIVSNDPSIIAGRVESKHKAIIAMMGVVKVKVSDINGKISKGDLLTTSGITGYAMKAQDSKPGTIIGKALENLTSSNGQINVLVNLQ